MSRAVAKFQNPVKLFYQLTNTKNCIRLYTSFDSRLMKKLVLSQLSLNEGLFILSCTWDSSDISIKFFRKVDEAEYSVAFGIPWSKYLGTLLQNTLDNEALVPCCLWKLCGTVPFLQFCLNSIISAGKLLTLDFGSESLS